MFVEDFSDTPKSWENTGFQATELARAAALIREMKQDPDRTIFLAFTANLVASGLRGVFARLIREGWIDSVITTGGSIDHDIIKSHLNYKIASFREDDAKLLGKYNRLGNILVPTEAYVLLEKKVQPVFKKMSQTKKVWSTRETIAELSKLCKGQHSILAACSEKNVPVFSPAFIDSALGLQLFFFKQDHKDFCLDATGDLKEMANLVLTAKKTSAIIVGGGSSKHFTLGANLLRGGLDSAVYFTTAQEYDGSLSGAQPREATSWGKVKTKATTAVVYGDATVTLPLAFSSV